MNRNLQLQINQILPPPFVFSPENTSWLLRFFLKFRFKKSTISSLLTELPHSSQQLCLRFSHKALDKKTQIINHFYADTLNPWSWKAEGWGWGLQSPKQMEKYSL